MRLLSVDVMFSCPVCFLYLGVLGRTLSVILLDKAEIGKLILQVLEALGRHKAIIE